MWYQGYKVARNKAWEVLILYCIDSLPIDLATLANQAKIEILLYSQSEYLKTSTEEIQNGDGFVMKESEQAIVYLNDTINNRHRRRFTLAHELGHVFLNHNLDSIHYRHNEIDSQDNIQEMQANVFARDLLMPATVLAALDIHTTEEIMELCHVSRQSAEIRAKRLEELYKRNMFNKHPLEMQVREQFDDFIMKRK